MAKKEAKAKVIKLTKEEKHIRDINLDPKIKKELLHELKEKKKENLKINSVNFLRHFEKNVTKLPKRKKRIDVPKQMVSIFLL